jgi:uncharacterized membrane protein
MMNKPVVSEITWMLAIMLSGVTAGMFLMDCFGFYPLLASLPDQTALQLHKQFVPMLRSLFQLAIGSTGIACIILILFFSAQTSRWMLIGSLACLITLVVYTNLALIPLNREIMAWMPDALPTVWKIRFSDMVFRERLRTFLPVVAFGLELLAMRRWGKSK